MARQHGYVDLHVETAGQRINPTRVSLLPEVSQEVMLRTLTRDNMSI
jgi:hypothetical protein